MIPNGDLSAEDNDILSEEDTNLYGLTARLHGARLLAQEAHAGQVDKSGKPYFLHVETVSRTVADLIRDQELGSEMFSLKAQIVGYLHDIIEDTDITPEDLRGYAIPPDCILAIEAITKNDGLSYQDYLVRVRSNKLATVVKIADMMHNSDLSRLDYVTIKDLTRREKYQKAIMFLYDTGEQKGDSNP